METSFFIFAAWMLSVMVSVTAGFNMAKKRNRDAEGWILIAAFVGPLALIALYWLGPAPPETREQKLLRYKLSAGLSTGIMIVLVLVMAVPLLRACFRF